MSELEFSAVALAFFVLVLIGLIAAALLYASYQGEFTAAAPEVATVQKLLDHAEQQYRAASSPETLDRSARLLAQLTENRQAARKVWFDFAQILLLNLLLPVLTAILGYVFGTMRTDKKTDPQG